MLQVEHVPASTVLRLDPMKRGKRGCTYSRCREGRFLVWNRLAKGMGTLQITPQKITKQTRSASLLLELAAREAHNVLSRPACIKWHSSVNPWCVSACI